MALILLKLDPLAAVPPNVQREICISGAQRRETCFSTERSIGKSICYEALAVECLHCSLVHILGQYNILHTVTWFTMEYYAHAQAVCSVYYKHANIYPRSQLAVDSIVCAGIHTYGSNAVFMSLCRDLIWSTSASVKQEKYTARELKQPNFYFLYFP